MFPTLWLLCCMYTWVACVLTHRDSKQGGTGRFLLRTDFNIKQTCSRNTQRGD